MTTLLKLYSRRTTMTLNHTLTKTATGWHYSMLRRAGQCDKEGRPVLYESLEAEFISYPADLPQHLEQLWDEAEKRGWGDEEVQAALDELSWWIQGVEKGKPSGGVWTGLYP